MDLGEAIAALRVRNELVPQPLRLPTDQEIADAEGQLRLTFSADYRRYLLEASDVVFGTLEPCLVTPGAGYLDLVETCHTAWELGVPHDWLPICEDNGDYYCLAAAGVRFWSHDGASEERWPDLATWIMEVWIGENE